MQPAHGVASAWVRVQQPLRCLHRRGSEPHTVKTLSKITADQGGSVLLEFTVVAPLLLLLCFGIVQYGLAFLVYNNMYDAARQGARQLAVSTADSATAEAEAEATVMELLVDWPTNWVVTPEDGEDDVSVTITVPAVEASIIKVVPMVTELRAEVVMRKE